MSIVWKITLFFICACLAIFMLRMVAGGIDSFIESIGSLPLWFLVGILAYVVLKKKKGEDRSWHHGTAGFASREEMQEFIVKQNTPLEPGSFYLSDTPDGILALPRRLCLNHVVILAGTNTGKTRGFVFPTLAWVSRTSFVTADMKGELWDHTAGLHERAIRYAPNEPEASEGFNWIPLCNNARMAQLCAGAIIESQGTKGHSDPFWTNAEKAFLSALFAHTAVLDVPTPLTAMRLVTRQHPDRLIEQLLNSPSELAREEANVAVQSDPKVRGGIVPAIAGKLQFLRDENVARFTSGTLKPPNFAKLRESPHAVYYCLQVSDIGRLEPLTTLFFSVVLDQISKSKIPRGEGTPVWMLLDEFGNIGALPDFAKTASLCRDNDVSICAVVQSLAQIEAAYGKADAQTILTCLQTRINLHGLDYHTAESVSKSLGDTTVISQRVSYNDGGGILAHILKGSHSSKTYSQSEHKRPLMTADEVTRLNDTEAIVRVVNKRPMRIPKIVYVDPPVPSTAKSLGPALALTFETPPGGRPQLTAGTDNSILDIEPPPLPVFGGSTNGSTN